VATIYERQKRVPLNIVPGNDGPRFTGNRALASRSESGSPFLKVVLDQSDQTGGCKGRCNEPDFTRVEQIIKRHPNGR
jgi:hypothetical protein